MWKGFYPAVQPPGQYLVTLGIKKRNNGSDLKKKVAALHKQHVSVFLLQSHQRQHNKDKPYKCPNCYRAYADSASLQIHLSAHAIKNAKAYCCSMCGRAYTSVSRPLVVCQFHFSMFELELPD